MSRRPAAFTQADIARAIRAAKQEGVGVRIVSTPDGPLIEFGDIPVIHSPEPKEPVPEPLEVM